MPKPRTSTVEQPVADQRAGAVTKLDSGSICCVSGNSAELQQSYAQISRREQQRIDAEEAERVRKLRDKARLD